MRRKKFATLTMLLTITMTRARTLLMQLLKMRIVILVFSLFSDFVTYSATSASPSDPVTVDGIINRGDKHFWLEAIDEEYKSQIENGTLELVDLLPGRKALGCKWVFHTKKDYRKNCWP